MKLDVLQPLLLLLLAFSVTPQSLLAQQSAPAQDTEVVRTNTDLVQTAVTVVDKAGKFIGGLQRDQFELLIDGKPRPINFFERVGAGTERERELSTITNSTEVGASTPAPVTINGRTLIFFVDDLHLTPDSLNRTRIMLRHFLDDEMRSRDNVAIVSASGQIGFLQQFSNNKSVLSAAIERLSPIPYDAAGYSAGNSTKMTEFMALTIDTARSDSKVLTFYVEECMKGASTFKRASGALALIRASCETQVKNSARAVLIQSAQITQNMYNSLESVMRSSARLPGRKLAFFVSDGFLLDAGPHAGAVRDKLDHVIDAAQRAGVVIYSIHAKGIVNYGFHDPDNSKPLDGNGRLDIASVGEVEATQDALHALAGDTGGRALRNTYFFERWVTAALDETSNYYQLSWRPEGEDEKLAKFRNVKISVIGHPEFTVRAPRGYVTGPTATETAVKPTTKGVPETPETEIRDVLADYYPATGVPTQLSLTYLNTPQNGFVVTSSMHVASSGVSYGNDGKQPATIRLAGVILNDKGKVAASFRNQLSVSPPKPGDVDGGVFYSHHSPLGPGIYQVRVAVRDELSARVGSAMQWIVIPDLSKGQLTASSLLLGGQVLDGAKNANGGTQVQLSVNHTFQRSSPLGYWLFVYNAKRDQAGAPHLTVQTVVARDGQTVLSSKQRQLDKGGPDPDRIPLGEEVSLKTLPPGHYDLSVQIKDNIAGTSVTQFSYFVVR